MKEILLYGDIGESFFGDSVLAKDVIKQLDSYRKEKEILVRINSGGGDVFEAFAIYNAMRTAVPRIITQNDSLAASAASYLLMAGDEILVAENSMVMTHSARAVGFFYATASDMRNYADQLERLTANIQEAYSKRSKASADVSATWVQDTETWFTAQQAIDVGLADKMGPRLNVKAQARPWIRNCPIALEPCVIDAKKRANLLREWELRQRLTERS